MYQGGSRGLSLPHRWPTVEQAAISTTVHTEVRISNTEKRAKSTNDRNNILNFATCGSIKGRKPYLNTLIHLGLYVYVPAIIIIAAVKHILT